MDENSETTHERHTRQTKEQFEALGRFVQAFEGMVFAVRTSISLLAGGGPKNQPLVNIMVNHRALSAQPLWEIYCGIIGQSLSESVRPGLNRDDLLAIISAINTEYADLVSLRNSLIHGTWFIGWHQPDQQDFSTFDVVKWRSTTKEGLSLIDRLPNTADELSGISARCEKQRSNIQIIGAAIHLPIPLEQQFRRDGARWIVT